MLDRKTAMGTYVTMTTADLGFNFRGCAMNRAREYKWNWVFLRGRSAPKKLMHSELFEA